MTSLAVTGWGMVCSAGVGAAALAEAMAGGPRDAPDVTGLYPEQLPTPVGHACVGFDVRALLGRKGTSFFDRATGLALVACGQAIEDSGLVVDERSRHRVGLALGTTVGSFRSSSDYSRETLVQDRPYLVNPVYFPNTVMNCAAGQAAIWYGLKGVNGTIAGGRLGFLAALRYAANALRRGYADAMLVGAVEEFTPHTAWAHQLLRRPCLPGEAAGVFVLEPADEVRRAGRSPVVELLAVASGYCPTGEPDGMSDALARCIRRALEQAGVEPGQARMVATGEVEDPEADPVEATALVDVFGIGVDRVGVGRLLGDCGAATGALQLAALLVRYGTEPAQEGQIGLMTSWSPAGAVGAAVVKGYSRAGTHSE